MGEWLRLFSHFFLILEKITNEKEENEN